MQPTVALVRGNSLNQWEGGLWSNLPGWSVLGVCSQRNLYPLEGLQYPVKRLRAATDFRLRHGLEQVFLARQQKMDGLEPILASATIAHTAEIYYYYTQQAVLAKQLNPALKVVTTVWDNSPQRFGHGYWPGPGQAPRWWERRVARLIQANAQGVDRFLPVTQGAAAGLEAQGVPVAKIQVLTPGLVQRTVVSHPLVTELLSDPRPFFLVVNRLVPEKGVADIIAGWQQFAKQDQRLIIVGAGPELSKLQAQAAHLQNSVRFVGTLPNDVLPPLYAQAQALILASRTTPLWEEQFGYVLVEAMSVGCPVISTRTGAIPEVVGKAGILVPEQSPTDLSKAMGAVTEPTVRQGLLAAAAEISRKYDVSIFQSTLRTIYESLL